MITLNDNEKAVYDACINEIYGDTGCEFDIPWGAAGLTKDQIKGYLGALEKKGLIQMDDTGDYYCDGWVVANPDGTPFKELSGSPLGDWTGEFTYKYNKKHGLYD